MPVTGDAVAQAADLFRVTVESARSLSDGDDTGDTFSCRRGRERCFLKVVSRDWSGNLAAYRAELAEVRWIADRLTGDIRVYLPLKSTAGELCEPVPAGGEHCVAWLTADAAGVARDRAYVSTPEGRHLLGRIVARLHGVAREYPLWRRERPADPGRRVGSAGPASGAGYGDARDWRSLVEAMLHMLGDDPGVANRVERLAAELERLPVDREGYGLVHSDLSLGNTVWSAEASTGIDFEGFYSWYAFNLALNTTVTGYQAEEINCALNTWEPVA